MSEEEAAIHRRLDKIIDIKKPLLPQVEKLTNREFVAFVRRPRHIEDTDGI
jgi:dihydroceramide fatty acyl 2-hydroxylase